MAGKTKRKLVFQRTVESWPNEAEIPSASSKSAALAAANAVVKPVIWAVKPNIGFLSTNANPMTVRPGSIIRRYSSHTVDDQLLAHDSFTKWPAEVRYQAWAKTLPNFDRDRALKNIRAKLRIRMIFTVIWLSIWAMIVTSMSSSGFILFFLASYFLSAASMSVICFSSYMQYQSILNERLMSPSQALTILIGRKSREQ